MKYFSKLKDKMIEKSNEIIIKYVLNKPDIWLEVVKVINNKYEHKIFNDLIIKENRFNNLKLQGLTILGGVIITDNIYIPEDDNLKDLKPFMEFIENDIRRDKNV